MKICPFFHLFYNPSVQGGGNNERGKELCGSVISHWSLSHPAPATEQSRPRIWIGGKLVDTVPFLVGSLELNQFGVEIGGGMSSSGTSSYNVSLIYYLANGRYIFPFSRQFQPYFGGGIIGVTATATVTSGTTEVTVSGGSSGYDIFGGLELPLDSYGLPITIFGGINYLGFGNIAFTYDEVSFTYPIDVSGTSFHVGLKFEF